MGFAQGQNKEPRMTDDEQPKPTPRSEDPWLIINAMRQIDLAERAQHLNPWMDLVAKRPPLERDALIEAGKEIWRYRVATVREHLDQSERQAGVPTVIAPTVVLDDKLAEMVYRPGSDPEICYLVHDFARPDDPPVLAQTLEAGGKIYRPPTTELIHKKVVLLPSAVEEYDTDLDLFLDIKELAQAYLAIDDEAFLTLACAYVLMSWVFDRFAALPFLRAIGEPGSGKTRLLQVFGAVSYRPTFAGGAVTAAPIFRIVDKLRGTLIIDEADFGKSDLWEEVVKILNAGYSSGFSVLRAERGADRNFEIGAYNCFGPKLLATRQRFTDLALESRCLTHTMPLLADLPAGMPLVLDSQFWSKALCLRNRLLLWRFRRWADIKATPTWRLPGVELRVNQIFQPLLACINDKNFTDSLLGTIRSYSQAVQADRRESIEGAVVGALLAAWHRTRCSDRVLLRSVTEELHTDYPSLSPERLSKILGKILGFETRRLGGMSHIWNPGPQLRVLAPRYGLNPEPPPWSVH
jgi:hypothetical protein